MGYSGKKIHEQSITEATKIHANKKIMVNEVISESFGKENPKKSSKDLQLKIS